MGNSLFSEKTLQTLQKFRKAFLWAAVWILIAELVIGAIIILSGSWSVVIGKIQGSFLIAAAVLFISVNNFIRMEKGNKTIQAFAMMSFICNIIWGVLAFLLLWEVFPAVWTETVRLNSSSYFFSHYTRYHLTVLTMIMLCATYAASGGFWISNVLSISETAKPVKPLKITAVVCMLYLWIFGTVTTLTDPDYSSMDRAYQLAALASVAFSITALAAVIISRTSRKKAAEVAALAPAATAPAPKTDAELRAEIEEKVRREMMEEKIRAEIKAEQEAAAKPTDTKPDSGE